MGRKTHRATRRPNLPASAPQSPSPPRPQPPPIASCHHACCKLPYPGPDLDPSIRVDSRLAWTCLIRGSIAEGFEIIQESISRHPNDVTLLRTRAVMHFRIGSLNGKNFIQHFKDCIASAEQALVLCPNLIGLMAIYAMSLFSLAKDKADYENVIQQCQKGLSIQDPIDPGKDVLVFQPDTEVEDDASKEARIESARRELRSLIQISNNTVMNMENCSKDYAAEKKASEAAMKMEKGCKDKDDVVQKTKTVQSMGDDEMWEPFLVSRKCQEGKRLAIEKELDKVKAWQHEIHMGGVAKDEKAMEGYLEGLGSKVGRRIRVLQYWKGLGRKKQRAFLRITVSELKDFHKSDQASAEVLKEAIEFLKEFRSWKFWECSICEKRFLDGELWSRHLDSKDHFGVLADDDAKILPELLGDAWLNKIVSGVWRPVDVDKMLKHIAEEARAKQEVGHDVAGESEETMEDRERDIDEKKWSYCDDAKRKGMLDQICSMFRLILRNSCLTQSMVQRWLRLTRFQLEKICPNVGEVFPDLEKTPLGICFLEYDQLEMLYRMTCDIYKHCQMVPLSKNGNFYEQIPSEGEYKERIDYADNFSCLLLDERFLTGEFKPQDSSDLADDESFVCWLFAGAEIGELVKSWKGVKAQKLEIAYSAHLFICTEMELLQSLCKKKLWLSKYERALSVVRSTCLQENSRSKTMQNHEPQKLVRMLSQKKDMHIDTIEEDDLFVCNVIMDILKDSSAVCAENFVSEAASFGLYTQESDLRAHEDEERQMKDRVLVDAEAAEHSVLEAIELKRNNIERKLHIVEGLIMKSPADFEGMSQNFGLLTAHDTQESELRAHEDEERQMKDRLLVDAEAAELYVLEAIELKRNDIERKLCIVDSLIMKSLADIERMRQNFGLLTAHDSRAIMLHLLKSFIRAHLENFASKDAEEKAQAAEKDLLARLALDSDKRKEDPKLKNVGKKSKKKKPFYKKRPEDKVPSKSKETIELEKKNAEVSIPITSSGSISDFVTTYESSKLERQPMLTAEIAKDEQLMNLIESEGMTIVEMIKNQRQIEDEIKQNRLEEQNKEMDKAALKNVEDDVPLFCATGESEEPCVSEPSQHPQAVANLGDVIFFGNIKVPLIPKPGEGDGSSNTYLPLPTEAYTEPGEHKQVEKSGPITLPGTGADEFGDSHPEAGNVHLDDTGNVGGEEVNNPDEEVDMHNHPDVDVFNDPDVLTMDQVLPYSRFFNRTNIKRSKVFMPFVSQDRGYSSA